MKMKKLILIIILLPTFLFGQNVSQLEGKKLHDKRHDEKQKTMKKEINSALKR